MNKQQLAQKIWASANQMRSKIEANEYKDYILGFIFYKYLSDKEVSFLKENDYNDEYMKTVTEDDPETVKWVQENIGYFISYENLFSTWLAKMCLMRMEMHLYLKECQKWLKCLKRIKQRKAFSCMIFYQK